MKSIISDHSSKAFEDILCPAPPSLQTREVLRTCPDNSFTYTYRYPRELYASQIAQEKKDALRALATKPMDGKRRSSQDEFAETHKRIEDKYRQAHFETDAVSFLWKQSERMLNLLRTRGLMPSPSNEDQRQALFKFVQTVDLSDFPEIKEDAPKVFAPNEYFELTQPKLVSQYGLPFYSTVEEHIQPVIPAYGQPATAEPVERIIGINTDWWGAFIGGDQRLGHECVFYVPELRFYFMDPLVEAYVPTTDEKVRLSLSQSLQQRAWGQEAGLATMLLTTFRTKKVLDEIISKAKTILAVEAGFFTGPDAKAKWGAERKVDVTATVTSFITSHVESAEGYIMPLTECLDRLEATSPLSLPRSEAVKAIEDALKVSFKKGLRHDLLGEGGNGIRGWKGLRLRPSMPTCDLGDHGVQSGPSAPSELVALAS